MIKIDEEMLNKIKEDYFKGLTYEEIQKTYNITCRQLKYQIQKNNWKRESNKSETLKGNKNAKGNKGGKGAGHGNKRALTTGEYENIFKSVLSVDEQNILSFDLKTENKKELLLQDYKMYLIREKRILERISKAKRNKYLVNEMENALTRVTKAKQKCITDLHRMEMNEQRLELDILRLEKEIEYDNAGENNLENDSGFIEALNMSAKDVWNDEETEK